MTLAAALGLSVVGWAGTSAGQAAPAPKAASPPRAAAPAAPSVAAPPPPTSPLDGDVRCLLAMVFLGQDKSRAVPSQIGTFFYIGRISARSPGLDLPAAMRGVQSKLTVQQIPAELERCGPAVQVAVRALQQSFPPPPAAAQPAPGAAAPAPAPQPR